MLTEYDVLLGAFQLLGSCGSRIIRALPSGIVCVPLRVRRMNGSDLDVVLVLALRLPARDVVCGYLKLISLDGARSLQPFLAIRFQDVALLVHREARDDVREKMTCQALPRAVLHATQGVE